MSPRRRWMLVLAALALVAAGLAVLAGGRDSPGDRPRVAQDRPGPVLLVPGYGGSTRALRVLASALRARGRTVTVVPAVGDGTGDLRAQARHLGRVADARLADGAPSVDVVGYSAGGVVTREWAGALDGARLARRIVTLGAPHHGTDVATLAAAVTPGACPKACRQLVPGSPLLSGLAETPAGPAWTAVWTRDDDIVTPPDSAELDGAVNVDLQAVCPGHRVSHTQLPTDPLVVGIVERALGVSGLHRAPPSGQCATLRASGTAPVSS